MGPHVSASRECLSQENSVDDTLSAVFIFLPSHLQLNGPDKPMCDEKAGRRMYTVTINIGIQREAGNGEVKASYDLPRSWTA